MCTPWRSVPSADTVWTCLATAGSGPAVPTMLVGNSIWVWSEAITIRVAAKKVAPKTRSQRIRLASAALPGERRFQRRRYPVDRIWLGDHRHAGEFGGRRVDMAAAGQDEGNGAFAQHGGDRPDAFAFQVDVEDGQVEVVGLDRLQRFTDAFAGRPYLMAER